jgi:hypothetical protein
VVHRKISCQNLSGGKEEGSTLNNLSQVSRSLSREPNQGTPAYEACLHVFNGEVRYAFLVFTVTLMWAVV